MKSRIVRDIEQTIHDSINHFDYGNHMQLNVIDPNHNREFIKYCISKSYEWWLQELTGFQREKTDKDLEFILDRVSDGLSGIKIIHKPLFKIHDYEKWDDGYIQLFTRTSRKEEPNYFIWGIIRMRHFKDILEKFTGRLSYFVTV